jgi:hypothetical protein
MFECSRVKFTRLSSAPMERDVRANRLDDCQSPEHSLHDQSLSSACLATAAKFVPSTSDPRAETNVDLHPTKAPNQDPPDSNLPRNANTRACHRILPPRLLRAWQDFSRVVLQFAAASI